MGAPLFYAALPRLSRPRAGNLTKDQITEKYWGREASNETQLGIGRARAKDVRGLDEKPRRVGKSLLEDALVRKYQSDDRSVCASAASRVPRHLFRSYFIRNFTRTFVVL